MANQLKMADVQTVLTLHERGWSARRIARELGMNRETVARHIRLRREAESKPAIAPTGSGGLDVRREGSIPVVGSPLVPGLPALDHAVSCGPGRPSVAAPWQAVIREKLKQGLEAQRIYQDLTADHGYRGTYYSVRWLVARLCQGTDLPMRRMECAPGVEAQVDFGRGVPMAIQYCPGNSRG